MIKNLIYILGTVRNYSNNNRTVITIYSNESYMNVVSLSKYITVLHSPSYNDDVK